MFSVIKRLRRFRSLLYFDNRAELIIQRMFFRGTRYQVYRINGIEAIVDLSASDTASIRTCIATDMYRRFLPLMGLRGRLSVMDIGANVGGFSLMLAVNRVETSKLVCVELNPNTYERLRFNIWSTFGHAAICINAGMSASARAISVPLGRGSTDDNIYRGARSVGDCQVRDIAGVSLDQVWREYFDGGAIDICKMDVEGAESELILSPESENRVLRCCRYLLVEIHRQSDAQRINDALAVFGLKKLSYRGSQDLLGVHLFANDAIPSGGFSSDISEGAGFNVTV